jgi:hypothetical protein
MQSNEVSVLEVVEELTSPDRARFTVLETSGVAEEFPGTAPQGIDRGVLGGAGKSRVRRSTKAIQEQSQRLAAVTLAAVRLGDAAVGSAGRGIRNARRFDRQGTELGAARTNGLGRRSALPSAPMRTASSMK